jgi:hypothetical protein
MIRAAAYKKTQETMILSDDEVSYMRWLSFPANEQVGLIKKPTDTTALTAFMAKHYYGKTMGSSKVYVIPKREFGKIAYMDLEYAGYWFSVDRRGYVRRHSYSTSGFGKS